MIFFNVYISDFVPLDIGIACRNGLTTSQENRCLYALDQYNHIVGCRSLEHLQDCGMNKFGIKLKCNLYPAKTQTSFLIISFTVFLDIFLTLCMLGEFVIYFVVF